MCIDIVLFGWHTICPHLVSNSYFLHISLLSDIKSNTWRSRAISLFRTSYSVVAEARWEYRWTSPPFHPHSRIIGILNIDVYSSFFPLKIFSTTQCALFLNPRRSDIDVVSLTYFYHSSSFRASVPNLFARVWICQYAPATSSYVPFYVATKDIPRPYTRYWKAGGGTIG